MAAGDPLRRASIGFGDWMRVAQSLFISSVVCSGTACGAEIAADGAWLVAATTGVPVCVSAPATDIAPRSSMVVKAAIVIRVLSVISALSVVSDGGLSVISD